MNSVHLGVSFMDCYVSKNPNGYEITGNNLPIVCLFIGAKSIELDNRIPFISKLKRNSETFASISEIKRLEMEICSVLDWKLQKTTNLDILEYLLTMGVVFDDDEVQGSKDLEKLKETTKRIEREAYFLANRVMKDADLLSLEPLILGCVSIAFLRKLNWITPVWSSNLTKFTGIDISEFESSLSLFESKMTKNPLVDLTNFSANSSSNRILKSFSNVDHVRISKRHSTIELSESKPQVLSRHQSLVLADDNYPKRPAILGVPPSMKRDKTDYFKSNFQTGGNQENSFLKRNSKYGIDNSLESLVTNPSLPVKTKIETNIFDDITNRIERHLKL